VGKEQRDSKHTEIYSARLVGESAHRHLISPSQRPTPAGEAQCTQVPLSCSRSRRHLSSRAKAESKHSSSPDERPCTLPPLHPSTLSSEPRSSSCPQRMGMVACCERYSERCTPLRRGDLPCPTLTAVRSRSRTRDADDEADEADVASPAGGHALAPEHRRETLTHHISWASWWVQYRETMG
jgi:hypothetical protein